MKGYLNKKQKTKTKQSLAGVSGIEGVSCSNSLQTVVSALCIFLKLSIRNSINCITA